MTVRVAQQIGMKRVVDVAKEFGVTDNMGLYLPMALGAGETTLLRMTMAYAMLANGALEITPSLIDRVQDRNGKTVYRHEPRTCTGCDEQAAAKPDGARHRRSAQALPRPGLGLPGREHDAGRDDARHRRTRSRRSAGRSPARPARPTTAATTGSWARRPTSPSASTWASTSRAPWARSNLETGGGNAVPIYEAIAKQIFKDKPPTPFRIPPGLRLVKFSYEGGTIDQVFKPGTEPGAEGYRPAVDRRLERRGVERRRRHRRPDRRQRAASGRPFRNRRDVLVRKRTSP